VFTFSLAGAKTYHQVPALRFVVRLFEAGSWPALYYILGNWYRKLELGKRNGILQSTLASSNLVIAFRVLFIFFSIEVLYGRLIIK
jgi:ACS family pantothenate transporter-like MFS transporter